MKRTFPSFPLVCACDCSRVGVSLAYLVLPRGPPPEFMCSLRGGWVEARTVGEKRKALPAAPGLFPFNVASP